MRRQIRHYLPDHEAIRGNRWLRPFQNTLLHPRLWDLNRHSAAGAVAAGMFCGLIPGPLQMLGAAICAVVFRVNLFALEVVICSLCTVAAAVVILVMKVPPPRDQLAPARLV